MSGNIADLTARRHKDSPDYDIEVWITGVYLPDNMTNWNIYIDGEDDLIRAADILERAVEILRHKAKENPT